MVGYVAVAVGFHFLDSVSHVCGICWVCFDVLWSLVFERGERKKAVFSDKKWR